MQKISNRAIIYITIVSVFILCISSTTIKAQENDVNEKLISLQNIFSSYIKKDLANIDLGKKNFSTIACFKIMVSDSIKLINYTASSSTLESLIVSIKKSLSDALDAVKKLGLDMNFYVNKNLVIPLFIFYKPNRSDSTRNSNLLVNFSDATTFKDSFEGGSPFYPKPVECLLFPTISYELPAYNKFSKYYKQKK